MYNTRAIIRTSRKNKNLDRTLKPLLDDTGAQLLKWLGVGGGESGGGLYNNYNNYNKEYNMSNYNYFEAVKEDVKDRLGDYEPRGEDETLEEYQERLHDALWIDDSVTGNGSGSYTFCTAKAREYVLGGIEQVLEACQEFDVNFGELIEAGEWERLDVTARCYYLSQAIGEVVTE